MVFVTVIADDAITSACLCGNMAEISAISLINPKLLTSSASLAPNEEQVVSVRYVGIDTSPREEIGHAKLVALLDTAMLLAVSICTRSLLMNMCRFLVPSRIYARVSLGVVVGQTRPWHHSMLVVSHCQRVNHCSWSRSLRRQATPLECERSSPPSRGERVSL